MLDSGKFSFYSQHLLSKIDVSVLLKCWDLHDTDFLHSKSRRGGEEVYWGEDALARYTLVAVDVFMRKSFTLQRNTFNEILIEASDTLTSSSYNEHPFLRSVLWTSFTQNKTALCSTDFWSSSSIFYLFISLSVSLVHHYSFFCFTLFQWSIWFIPNTSF